MFRELGQRLGEWRDRVSSGIRDSSLKRRVTFSFPDKTEEHMQDIESITAIPNGATELINKLNLPLFNAFLLPNLVC